MPLCMLFLFLYILCVIQGRTEAFKMGLFFLKNSYEVCIMPTLGTLWVLDLRINCMLPALMQQQLNVHGTVAV